MNPSSDGAGALIRRLRLERGLSQHQLAIRVGTTQTAISRLERGAQSPTVEHLAKVLLSMGVRLDLHVQEIDPWTDRRQLAEFASLTPAQRLERGLASSRELGGLVGTARQETRQDG